VKRKADSDEESESYWVTTIQELISPYPPGSISSPVASSADLSISCVACNWFTVIAFYPLNVAAHLLFIIRINAWETCYDFMRYQWAMFSLFSIFLYWRGFCQQYSFRDGFLLVLASIHLYLNYHLFAAVHQAIDNFQLYLRWLDDVESNNTSAAVPPTSPLEVSPVAVSIWELPSSPYHLSNVCGHSFSIWFVRLLIIDIGFTSAGCGAYLIRLLLNRITEKQITSVVKWISRNCCSKQQRQEEEV